MEGFKRKQLVRHGSIFYQDDVAKNTFKAAILAGAWTLILTLTKGVSAFGLASETAE